jgi:acyl carrier protein
MTIEEQIRDYIATNMLFSDNGYPYEDGVSFLEEGIVDSTGVLELILFVEETFGVQVADEDVTPDNFDSVAQLAGYIRTKAGVPARGQP